MSAAVSAARRPSRFIHAIADFNKPLVAAVNGPAIGVGATLLLHCDLVYASPEASLLVPFVDLGLVPEAGSSMLLPSRVGFARAAALLMLGEPMDAEAACTAGLVNAVVPAAALHDHARAKALKLAAKPPAALAATRVLMRGEPSALHAHMQLESAAFSKALQGNESREKRSMPSWSAARRTSAPQRSRRQPARHHGPAASLARPLSGRRGLARADPGGAAARDDAAGWGALRRPAGVRLPGPRHDVGGGCGHGGADRRRAATAGLCQRRPHRAAAAELPGLSRAVLRRAAGRAHRRELQPALYRAGAGGAGARRRHRGHRDARPGGDLSEGGGAAGGRGGPRASSSARSPTCCRPASARCSAC